MAATKSVFLLPFLTLVALLLASSSFLPTAEPHSHTFAAGMKRLKMKEEKLTHLHFYWSNIRGGPNPTALIVAPVLNNATFYGVVVLNEDPLSLGPHHHNSTSVGKARGVYFFPSDTTNFVYEMTYNFAFTHGDYNGSSISVMGSVHASLTTSITSEIAVTGGTGVFRFARGYGFVKGVSFDPVLSVGVNELDIYVSHY